MRGFINPAHTILWLQIKRALNSVASASCCSACFRLEGCKVLVNPLSALRRGNGEHAVTWLEYGFGIGQQHIIFAKNHNDIDVLFSCLFRTFLNFLADKAALRLDFAAEYLPAFGQADAYTRTKQRNRVEVRQPF